ncbi:AraC family transcriptional regulator [Desulfobotulus sp.]|uniref:helix-turn-helix domain-containing protein n=1 Tax=Desulfobotulus sp. TaxID=1940337 RepID=UPI002A35893D|nr:AraC family transcriptional regulator [Desulfobotulus sp.]MDY0162815.1 AraC family transcriptional regulator [Desulfobotulus sp.]
MGLNFKKLTITDIYDPSDMDFLDNLSRPKSLEMNPAYGRGTACMNPIRKGLAFCTYDFCYKENVAVSAGSWPIPDKIWFYVCLSGSSHIILKKRSLHITPGTSDIFTGGFDLDMRQHMQKDTSYKMLSLLLDPVTLTEITGMEPEALFRLTLKTNRSKPSKTPKEMRLAAEILMQGCHVPASKKIFYEAKALELIAYQVGLMERQSGKEKKKREEKSYVEKIHYAAEIMENNLLNPPGIFDLADLADLNHNRVIQGFKEVYGQTPYEYLSHIRLQKAAEKMRKGECNVTEAAFSVGYANLSHFSRIFRKEFGVNPSDFQKKTSSL